MTISKIVISISTTNTKRFMFSLTYSKQRRSARARVRLVNRVQMAHEINLAKGAKTDRVEAVRLLHRRSIDHELRSLRHTMFPPAQRWVSLLMRYLDDHLWEDSKRAGDIWNGRLTRQTLEDILHEHTDSQIPPAEYTSALHWLQYLTSLLQNDQTALYTTRRHILRYSTSNFTPINVTLCSLRQHRPQMLFSA